MSYLSEIFPLRINIPNSNCHQKNPRCRCGRFWFRRRSCSKFRCQQKLVPQHGKVQPNDPTVPLAGLGSQLPVLRVYQASELHHMLENLGPVVWCWWCPHVMPCLMMLDCLYIIHFKYQGCHLKNWWLQLPFPLRFRFELRNSRCPHFTLCRNWGQNMWAMAALYLQCRWVCRRPSRRPEAVQCSVAEARFHSTACCQFSEHACEVATWK